MDDVTAKYDDIEVNVTAKYDDVEVNMMCKCDEVEQFYFRDRNESLMITPGDLSEVIK